MMADLLQQYQADWDNKFKFEAEKIKGIIGDDIKDIEHIGSTAIPGSIAKPIIDIAILVDSIEGVDFFVEKLSALGYIYRPEMSSVERIFLRKGSPTEYHLSISCPQYGFWKRQIEFRDRLRQSPELVEEYNALKLKNIKNVPENELNDLSLSPNYNKGKDDFVAKVLELVS